MPFSSSSKSTSRTTIIIPTNSNSGSSENDNMSDKTVGIILGSVFGGIFGIMLIMICIFYIEHRIRIIRNKQNEKKQQCEFEKNIARLELIVGPYIDKNPNILDMDDRKIPEHLQQNIDNLNENDAKFAINVIAKRRVKLPIDVCVD